ncbi:MAG: polyprenyl synthetase family protein [Planctomycetota bacterium]|jgi:octaprenyl-diphosphate synthase
MSSPLPPGVDAEESMSQDLGDALAEVEAIFETQLLSDFPAVNELCRHVERYRGKRLRPTLVLLSGLAASGADRERGLSHRHRVLGAVVEMIHMATLVHDDVLDEADVRRRGATVNRLRGNETAVMLGDYLISNAFHLCSSLDDPGINLELGSVTNTVCEGELLQLHHRDDLSLDEATCIEIVRRKTAALVAGACRLGGRLAGADAERERALAAFGEATGIAFQIQDDLLDLAGDAEVVGKTLGRDLDKGKLTLPSVLHLASSGPERREAMLDAIARRDAGALRRELAEHGGVEIARTRAAAFIFEAKEHLATLPESPARDLLASLAEAVIHRNH